MVRTYQEVPKRAKNSITAQLEKLVKRYGEKAVRLVTMKHFDKSAKQKQLEREIEQREIELQKLKRMVK